MAVLRLLPAIVQWMTPSMWVVGIVAMLFLLSFRSRPMLRRYGAIAFAGTASATLLLLISATRTDVYADYAIGMLPLFFSAAGAAVMLAAEQASPRGWALVGAVTAVLIADSLPSTASHLLQGTRFEYRPALEKIGSTAPVVPVFTWPVVIARFYAPTLDIRELHLVPSELDASMATVKDFWVIASFREYGLVGDKDSQGAAWLGSHCRIVETTRGLRFDSRQYEVRLERCSSGP
jgi:hypothetical protein